MSEPNPKSLADVGEFGVIAAIRDRLSRMVPVDRDGHRGIEVGSGDDAAVVLAPDGRVVVTIDTLIDRVHFRMDWASGHDIGRRAAATSLADISAMGATATALVVSLSAPANTGIDWTLQLADGLAEEAALTGASVVGGDLTRSNIVSLTVTALGDLAGARPVLRNGARVGDVVAVAGRLGWAEAGRAVLSRGFSSPRALVAAYRRPEPPYASGPVAALAGASAMVDVSDGLVSDLGHIARASGVVANLVSSKFEVPDPIAAVAAAYGSDPLLWILTGGQDHALVATFAEEQPLPAGFVEVGTIVADSSGRLVAEKGGETEEIEPNVLLDGDPYGAVPGHRHF